MTKLNEIELFLLDMDGTIYLENDLFDGTLDFINKIIKENKKYVFMTNNSSKSKTDYINKLTKMNIPCSYDNIFTSGMAMGVYLHENYPNKNVYLVGTNALKGELLSYNVNIVNDNPDIVVVGFDRELNYEKLEKACKFLCDGAIFLATNVDYICHMLTVATNKKPKFIGKPDPSMIYLLSEKFGIPCSKIAVIGDRVYTDIASGYNAHAITICVLSGESTMETINDSEIKPDYIFNSIKDIIDLI